MSGTFTDIDLSQLPTPAAIEAWTFDAIVDARVSAFAGYWAAAQKIDPTLPDFNTGSLNSEPTRMLAQTGAYREGLVRQRINDAVLATTLAYAQSTDLDVRAADYATLRASGELDPSLRRRAQLAWENLSIGGSYGGYTYRTFTVSPVEIGDVGVYGHEIPEVPKGEVHIVVMSAGINPSPSPSLLARVLAAFPRDGRKVNDLIRVVAPNVLPYTIDATLLLKAGSDSGLVIASQKQAAQAYADARRVIGGFVTTAHVIGQLVTATPDVVVDCQIRSPLGSVGGGPFDVPWCTGLRVVATVIP